MSYSDTYIRQLVDEAISSLPAHTQSHLHKLSSPNSLPTKLSFLKTMGIKDFGVFATMLQLPFFRNPQYQLFFYNILSTHTYIYWTQPRFTMKTTFMCAYMAWLNIHDTYTHKQRPVIAYYHSNIYKAQDYLS